MEWFPVTAVYLWLAAIGALVVFVLDSGLSAVAKREKAHSRSGAPGTAATERVHSRRAAP